MVKKEFNTKQGFLHIPTRSAAQDDNYYVSVMVDGIIKNEFLIGIATPGEEMHFYVAMDVARYHSEKITLICEQEDVDPALFDGIIEGSQIQDHPELYPDLYREPIRQQVHFSPARGWMNDPNGLFYKDGVFNVYFQHNPLDNRHYSTNCSWGHAQTRDGIHFQECGDAIMPRNSRYNIASGSALVDKYNIAGFGSDAVLATYTDLRSMQYHGRPAITSGVGQMLMYSLDGGMTFHYLKDEAIISVPDHCDWRDPKILQIDAHTIAIAVYETYEGKNCISIYKSTDCKNWEFCSRLFDFYECPDLFCLKVLNSDEEIWVAYGNGGRYVVGTFEDFQFHIITDNGFLDYGNSSAAGQTFNNYDDPSKRIYTTWLADYDHTGWSYDPHGVNNHYGFSQSLALFTELTLIKTDNGYRMFRAPIAAVKELRDTRSSVLLSKNTPLTTPSETLFTLKKGHNASIRIGNSGFDYCAQDHKIITTASREYAFYSPDDLEVRMITDTRSVEIYLQNEIVVTFHVHPEALSVECDYEIVAEQYTLKSIWTK